MDRAFLFVLEKDMKEANKKTIMARIRDYLFSPIVPDPNRIITSEEFEGTMTYGDAVQFSLMIEERLKKHKKEIDQKYAWMQNLEYNIRLVYKEDFLDNIVKRLKDKQL